MPDQPPITVVCSSSEAYAGPLTVMLTSVVCNLRTARDVDIYILHSLFSDALRQKVEASLLQNKKDFYRLTIHWPQLDPALLTGLPVGGHLTYISVEAYSRLLAPALLPATCTRAVYLDSDLVVLADVADLQDALDDHHVIGAVSEITFEYVSTPKNEKHPVVFDYVERGIPATNRYFNAGVLVMNLTRWRKENVTPRVLEYIRASADRLYYYDQGGLNALLYDRWQRLDQRWNVITDVLYPERWREPAYSRRDYLLVRNDPFVVHFSGRLKPWAPGQKEPRCSFFARYLKLTLFKDEMTVYGLENWIGFRAYLLVWRWRRKVGAFLQELRSRRVTS